MYGLINKSVKDFVTLHYGASVWEEIFRELGLSSAHFVSMESFPDELTFRIMDHVCQKLGRSQAEFFTYVLNLLCQN